MSILDRFTGVIREAAGEKNVRKMTPGSEKGRLACRALFFHNPSSPFYSSHAAIRSKKRVNGRKAFARHLATSQPARTWAEVDQITNVLAAQSRGV